MLMVQRSVALVPTGMPVTVEFADVLAAMNAVPDTKVHSPVPVKGEVAAIVKLPLLHIN